MKGSLYSCRVCLKGDFRFYLFITFCRFCFNAIIIHLVVVDVVVVDDDAVENKMNVLVMKNAKIALASQCKNQ